MSNKILLLGSTGFIGGNIMPVLSKDYNVIAPSREELDLFDTDAVRRYLQRGRFYTVINCAAPTGHSSKDKFDDLFELSLRSITLLAHCNDLYGKMIYFGSGAEYGKHRPVINICEEEFGHELPRDTYGLSRYIISELAEKSGNIYNLRLFGCYGPGDPPYKLIPHIMKCIREDKQIELKQNTMFDFLYVKDIAPVISHFIENEPKYNVYNLCSGEPILIGDIAIEVKRQMNSNSSIIFKFDGYGLEYTGSNERLRSELKNWKPRTVSEGIREIIEDENRKV